MNYCYAADQDEAEDSEDTEGTEEEEGTVEYSEIGYFFEADTDEANEKYSIITTPDQLERQLFAQYPPKSVVDHAVVMDCFDDEANERINRAWTNVRCFDLDKLFIWK